MKKLAITVLLLICTDVMAAWTELQGVPVTGFAVYVDLGKIRNKGMDKVRMWHLIDFQQAETTGSGRAYLSRKEYVEYNCEEEHYRVLGSSLYTGNMGRGKVVSFSSDARQWEPVEFNTLEEALWKAACDKPGITHHD